MAEPHRRRVDGGYYGRYYRSALLPLLRRVSYYLRRWAGKKYRRLQGENSFMA